MTLSRWVATVRAVAADTGRRARGQDLMLIAAGLTFYAGIAVVPLLLVGLYGAGLVLEPERVMTLVDRLAQYASSATGAAQFLRSLGETGPRLGLASLLASVIAASTYGEGLLRAVDTLEGEQRPTRTMLGRLRVLPYLGVFPLVTLLGLLAVMVLPERLGDGVTGQALGIYLTFWVGWALATALLVVLYRLFAARTVRWAAIVWASLAAGSFLTGMSLGWVLVLRFGLTVGRAFGGSELVGHIVLLTIYLLFVQVTILMGYLLARSIDHLLSEQVARPPESVGSGPGRPAEPAPAGPAAPQVSRRGRGGRSAPPPTRWSAGR